ncbi:MULTISPECIES: oligosaccharide flippase family protein [Aeromonas]|uniref:oligosaccharide flippase family protein n=1 Tax=Aeromonas TaxID=642 RepID=UPI0005AA6D08|nr:oligosaccharide flippase family protein [Aeromonas caviae]MBS4636159.1 oligosaccharide flippase family protein [Aeromonas caviae]WQD90501.1 oligosaccharide flippase family protein [Aeromonas caviae]SQH59019.1 Putative O-antigen transporter [Aeromonas caviae]
MREVALSKNILSLMLVQFSNYIAPLLVLPYLSRVLGLEGFGTVAMSMSLCSIALIITDYGFGISAPYWLARNKENKRMVADYLGAIFTVKLFLFLITSAFVLLYFRLGNTIPDISSIHIAIITSIFFQSFQPNWFFLGIEKMKKITISMVSAKLLYVFLIFIFIKEKNQTDSVLIFFALSNLLATSIGVISIYKEGYWISMADRKKCYTLLKEGGVFFVSRLAVGVYTSASTFLVGSFSGTNAAALYNSAEKLYQAGQSIISPVSQALFPYLARTGNKKDLYKFVGVGIIPMAFTAIIGISYSQEIMGFLFGEQFISAHEYLEIFLIALLINFVGVNFGYPAFASINRIDIANRSVIFAAVIQILALSVMYITDAITAKNICLSVLAVESLVMLIRVIFFYFLQKK